MAALSKKIEVFQQSQKEQIEQLKQKIMKMDTKVSQLTIAQQMRQNRRMSRKKLRNTTSLSTPYLNMIPINKSSFKSSASKGSPDLSMMFNRAQNQTPNLQFSINPGKSLLITDKAQ